MQNISLLKEKIIHSIKSGLEISPILFLGKDLENINIFVKDFAEEILKDLKIPFSYLETFQNDENSIKIEEFREFTKKLYIKPVYETQIFFIKDFGKATNQVMNASLKILEEPGIGNLIFLSATNKRNFLETVLSRVQTFEIYEDKKNLIDENIYNLLNTKNKKELLKIFYNLEDKKEAKKMLQTLVYFYKENNLQSDFWDEIQNDLNYLENDSVMAKLLMDKYLKMILI